MTPATAGCSSSPAPRCWSAAGARSAARADAAPAWPVRFVDVAQRARASREPSIYGGVDRKRFIIETNGAGVALARLRRRRLARRAGAERRAPRRTAHARARLVRAPADAPPIAPLSQPPQTARFEDVTARAGLRRTGWASSVCAGDYDNDGWHRPVPHRRTAGTCCTASRGGRFEDVDRAARPARRPATRWGSGCTLRRLRPRRPRSTCSSPTTCGSTSRPPPNRATARTACGKALPSTADRRGCRPRPTAVPQRTGDGTFDDVSERVGRRGGDRALLDDRGGRRLRRRRLGGHLRRLRLDRGHPLSQQPRRHLHRRAPSRAARRTARTATRRPAWASRSATTTRDGRLDMLKTHFADDIPALYRNARQRPVRGRGERRPALRRRTATSNGAPACPTSTTTGCPTSSTSPATSIRRSSACCRNIRTAARASCSANLGGGALRDVTRAERSRRDGAALEPRRRLRRLSTTTATSTCWS